MGRRALLLLLCTLSGCRGEDDPYDIELRAALAVAEGDYAEAEVQYQRLRGVPGADERALSCNLAGLAHAQGRCAEAEDALLDLRAAGYRPASVALAVCLRERGREEEALSCALESQEGRLRDSEVADLLSMTGRAAEATVAYGRLVSPDPLMWFNLVSSLGDEGYAIDDGAFFVLSHVDPSDELYPYALELVASCVVDPTDYLELASDWRAHHESEATSWR